MLSPQFYPCCAVVCGWLITVSARARICQCAEVHLCVGMVDTRRTNECRQRTNGIEGCGV